MSQPVTPVYRLSLTTKEDSPAMKRLQCLLETYYLMDKDPTCDHMQPGGLRGAKSDSLFLDKASIDLVHYHYLYCVMRSQKKSSWGRI